MSAEDAASPVTQKPIQTDGTEQKDVLRIIAEVEPRGAKQVILQVGTTKVAYDVDKAILDTMPLQLAGGPLRIRVITDRPLYEVWGGAGEVHRTNYRDDRGLPISDIRLVAVGGEAVVTSFTVYPMRSIWK